MVSTRQHGSSSLQTSSRDGLLLLSSVPPSYLRSSGSSSGLVTVSYRGLWASCKCRSMSAVVLKVCVNISPRLIFQLSMIIIYPTIIHPLFNKLSPLQEGELRTRIESLASRLQFPLKHLYEIDGSKRSSHSNAYFFGLPWVSSSLSTLYDSSILNIILGQTYRHFRHTHQTEQAGRSRSCPGT